MLFTTPELLLFKAQADACVGERGHPPIYIGRTFRRWH